MTVHTGMFSIEPALRQGERVTNRKTYTASVSIGSLIQNPKHAIDSKYSILREEGIGSLVALENIRGIYVSEMIANKMIRTKRLGISTIGIGYIPSEAEKNNEGTRRWPRNWYGDNIKN